MKFSGRISGYSSSSSTKMVIAYRMKAQMCMRPGYHLNLKLFAKNSVQL
jgi:hypothetical protein